MLSERETPTVPGAPGSGNPAVAEPTKPRDPLPPKPDQAGPERRTATGAATEVDAEAVSGQGRFLTTAQGARLRDSDHSLKAGERGPTLLQDHHLREKITHFDHERIPERVVHARGAGAHGTFIGYGNARSVTKAGFLAKEVETPVFVRFSTVLGSRGSADTVRDTRGFATKFYTDEGTFDLVGNNIPVFFIQDGIKFPDVIHAGKPHPDREIPQAQSAHDTFWDFVSLHTEAQHHTIWNMSDRGIPRSYRTMEGFGVHTFRCVNNAGETSLVKFHWKPVLGVHSLTWEEAQLLAGTDPDFHRRDLADAIEAGAYPQWELGVQVFPDTPEEMFDGIDLLDPTKLVPEELAPVQPIGLLTLTAQPDELLRRDRAGRLPCRQPRAGHRRHQRPAAPGAAVLLRRHPADPAGRTELRPDPDQPAARAGQRHAARRLPPGRGPRRRRAVQAELARRRVPVLRRWRSRRRLRRCAGPRRGVGEDARGTGVVRRPLQPGAPVLAEHDAAREGAHRRGVHLRAREVLRAGDQGAPAAGAGQHRPGAVCAGRCRAGAPGAGPDRDAGSTSTRARPCRSSGGGPGRPTVASSGSSSTPTATSAASTLSGRRCRRPAWCRWSSRRTAGSCRTAPPSSAPSPRRGRSSSTPSCSPAAPLPGADALVVRDSKAGEDGEPQLDPRVALLLQECFRHAKAIGAWGAGVSALELAGVAVAPGVLTGDDPAAVFAERPHRARRPPRLGAVRHGAG